jgi:hypothetical protein
VPAETAGVVDATDDVYQNNLRSEVARQKSEDEAVIRRLMGDKQGRSWVYRLLLKCHLTHTPFHGEETHKSAFAMGEHNIGLQLFDEISEVDIGRYLLMMEEAKEEARRQEKELKKRNEKAEGKGEPPLRVEDQAPDLAPPAGWPGHVPSERPPVIPEVAGGDPPEL